MKPNPNEIARIANEIGQRYGSLEEELIQLIIARLIDGPPDGPKDTGAWQVEKLLAVKAFRQDVIRIILKHTRTLPQEVRPRLFESAGKAATIASAAILAQAAARGLIAAAPGKEPAVPWELFSSRTAGKLQLLFQQAMDASNLVNTTLLDSAQQEYIDILNTAAALVADGESPAAAIKAATKELIDRGLTGFTDAAGRRWEPQAVVERIIRTTWNNASNAAAFGRLEDLGVDTILVSSHLGARPKCSLVQGRIFSLSGDTQSVTDKHGATHPVGDWNQTSYGEPDGILGINCRHHIMPFFDGLTEKIYDPIDEDKNREYYKQEQKQRRLERELRHLKRERNAATALGDKDSARDADRRARAKAKDLIAHISEYKLERSRARESPVAP